MHNPFTSKARAVRLLKAMTEDEAREAVREAKPEMHLKYCPGKHPLTRMKLNGAVEKRMDEMEASENVGTN